LFQLLRDHYEGTPFDLTKGVLAGPWGNPWRQSLRLGNITKGNFQRATSLRRTSYSFLSQSRGWLPNYIGGLVWYSQHEPATSVYVPFYPAISDIPKTWSTGSLYRFSSDSAWWAFAAVAGWADRFYSLIKADIQAKQSQLEEEGTIGLKRVEDQALNLLIDAHQQNAARSDNDARLAVTSLLNDYTHRHSVHVVKEWWNLFSFLIASYRDGYYIPASQTHKDKIAPTLIPYPKEYLDLIGFTSLPDLTKVPTGSVSVTFQEAISSQTAKRPESPGVQLKEELLGVGYSGTCVVASIGFAFVGGMLATFLYREWPRWWNRKGYVEIP